MKKKLLKMIGRHAASRIFSRHHMLSCDHPLEILTFYTKNWRFWLRKTKIKFQSTQNQLKIAKIDSKSRKSTQNRENRQNRLKIVKIDSKSTENRENRKIERKSRKSQNRFFTPSNGSRPKT